MKIASANVALQAQHAYSVRLQSRETLRAWIGDRRPNFEGSPSAPPASPFPAPQAAPTADSQAVQADAASGDPRLALLKMLIELLTGKPVTVFDASQLQSTLAAQPLPMTHGNPPPPSAGYGVEYDYHASRREIEQTSFSATGTIKTADGQTIEFQLDLAMSRQTSEQVDVSFRAGDGQRKDPLVINFGGAAAQLVDTRFRFDLNASGKPVDIPLLAGGSGYLALDRNGNGKIDSGAELFGPGSGSGFKELAGYDQDGNGWIDENDATFGKLKVWTPDQAGQGNLTGLKDLGVGALYIGSAATPFELRGQNNSDLGATRASGLYLTEAGKAGSLQEVDLTV